MMTSPTKTRSDSVTVVVIGAGHAGLAISSQLTARAIDHVVLERGQIANSWRTERWDSLRLLSPNWQLQLPGFSYQGGDPDGFMGMNELTQFLDAYAEAIAAPVHTETTVESVSRTSSGYRIKTNRGIWKCCSVVLASGICNSAALPTLANQLPKGVQSLSPLQYTNPAELAAGAVLVVGASATGLQLAEEIHRSGREVTLCVGEHVRLPRVYRGKDIQWWMDNAGILDQPIDNEAEPERARTLPSPQLIGTTERRTLDLNALQDQGVSIVGRLAGVRDNIAQFSGSLRNCGALADLKMNRLLDTLDQWATESKLDLAPTERFEPTRIPANPTLSLDFEEQPVKTVIWATGFRPDYSWLKLPVLNRKGRLIHHHGVVGTATSNTPGLYAMGLSFMRKRKSSFIYGANDDAHYIADAIATQLIRTDSPCAAPAPGTHPLPTTNADNNLIPMAS